MTEFGIPLPPDDLVMVWDKDADPWSRSKTQPPHTSHRGPGGWWVHTNGDVLHWSDLIGDHGPLTDYEPRCEAVFTGQDMGEFRCLLAPNHSGHHKLPENCWSTP